MSDSKYHTHSNKFWICAMMEIEFIQLIRGSNCRYLLSVKPSAWIQVCWNKTCSGIVLGEGVEAIKTNQCCQWGRHSTYILANGSHLQKLPRLLLEPLHHHRLYVTSKQNLQPFVVLSWKDWQHWSHGELYGRWCIEHIS